jgi:hypothetical protein
MLSKLFSYCSLATARRAFGTFLVATLLAVSMVAISGAQTTLASSGHGHRHHPRPSPTACTMYGYYPCKPIHHHHHHHRKPF